MSTLLTIQKYMYFFYIIGNIPVLHAVLTAAIKSKTYASHFKL